MLVCCRICWEYLCVISFHGLSLLTGLDRTLEFVYIMLSLLSLGLTNGIWLSFLYRVCESRGS
jgi:hypothetical protein